MHPLIWILIILVAVIVGVVIIDKTIPAEFNGVAKLIIGVIGLIAIVMILLQVFPMAGIG